MSNLVELIVAEPDQSLFKQAQTALANTENFEVSNADMLEVAGADLQHVKALAKEIEEKRVSITGPINQALKAVNALFAPPKAWLENAEIRLKNQIYHFQKEQQRIADEQQRKLNEVAEREKAKIQSLAAAAEAKAKAEAEAIMKAAEEAQARGDEAVAIKLTAKATAKLDAADAQIAEAQLSAATLVAPTVISSAPKLKGIGARTKWRAIVKDPDALAKHICTVRQDLIEIIEFDQSKLDKLANALHEKLVLPGLEVREEGVITARAAK